MTDTGALIAAYASGPELLRKVVEPAPESDWDRTPIQGKWSLRQVVCHLADAEIVYADRFKRVLAEEAPTLSEADPNAFVPALMCSSRDLRQELRVIDAVRAHMLPILRSCSEEHFQRTGVHSLEGRMTLRTLLERITGHIPHHVKAIEQKLEAMRAGSGLA